MPPSVCPSNPLCSMRLHNMPGLDAYLLPSFASTFNRRMRMRDHRFSEDVGNQNHVPRIHSNGHQGRSSPDNSFQRRLDRLKIVIEEYSRRATQPTRSDVQKTVRNGTAAEPRIVLDRTDNVRVKNEHVVRARELPITLDRRARRGRMQGLLEEAPALRTLIALDRHNEPRRDRRSAMTDLIKPSIRMP